MLVIAVLLGFANWIATTIIVESELTRPLREWVDQRTETAWFEEHETAGVWAKVRYLIGCHLCTGTWVALAEACFVTIGVSSGLAGIVLSALVFKGIGHTILNINARLSP